MPGIASLEKQEYYANQRNHFWKIMCSILNSSPVPAQYEHKVHVLQANNIGLWDALKSCDRNGSLDIHIKNYDMNDFEALFVQFPSIKTIVFNGKESYKYFLKKFGQIKGITYYVMPSTSPANTMSFDNKLKIWSTCF